GYTVPFYYDPLLCKLMTWGKTREEAIGRMKRALAEMKIEGIATNIPFHSAVMDDPVFNSGKYTTNFIEERQIIPKLRRHTQTATQP
ncbi:MAG: acetyl-CoA carboxylase biotin carboxylase subunit, partial [Dehalococcoidales bacterium]|nr:acetyl-CoA carboxylase biotin carboxylase subunit [Dehalococcoidales bacterium]